MPNNGFHSKKLKNHRSFWILFQKFYIFAADKIDLIDETYSTRTVHGEAQGAAR